MRAEFPWLPVYHALYFEADPQWFPIERPISSRRLLYPSAAYPDLLRIARQMVFTPPRKMFPVSADDLKPHLDALRRELIGGVAEWEFQGLMWDFALGGVDRAEHLSHFRISPDVRERG